MSERKDAAKATSSRRRLGRGLTSLISTAVPVSTDTSQLQDPPADDRRSGPPGKSDQAPTNDLAEGAIRLIATDQIKPNPHQPRQRFNEAALDKLAASIKSAGLMQPVVVRPDPAGGFQLVVGERRWRAARKIGLARLPALIRELDDEMVTEWALIENIQREDLNPLERADGFRRLIDDYGLTHVQVGDRLGMDRSTVTNLLRLHELDDFTKDAVRTGHISHAQAKVLLGLANLEARQQLAKLAIREGWSVRTLQRRADTLAPKGKRRSNPTPGAGPIHRQDLERRLSDHLGTKVRIQPGRHKGRGQLIIEYYTLDQFDGLTTRLGFDSSQL